MKDVIRHLTECLVPPRPYRSSTPEMHSFASEILACDRALGFRLLGTREVAGGDSHGSLVNFSIGNHIHDVLQEAFRRTYPDCETEVKWVKLPFSGRADVLYVHETGERTVVEFKTMGTRAFADAVKRQEPQAHHYMQACVSAWALDATLVRVIYVNKTPWGGDSPFADFVLPYDEGRTLTQVDRHVAIQAIAKSGEVPPPILHDGTLVLNPYDCPSCVWCPHQARCTLLGTGQADRSQLAEVARDMAYMVSVEES